MGSELFPRWGLSFSTTGVCKKRCRTAEILRAALQKITPPHKCIPLHTIVYRCSAAEFILQRGINVYRCAQLYTACPPLARRLRAACAPLKKSRACSKKRLHGILIGFKRVVRRRYSGPLQKVGKTNDQSYSQYYIRRACGLGYQRGAFWPCACFNRARNAKRVQRVYRGLWISLCNGGFLIWTI